MQQTPRVLESAASTDAAAAAGPPVYGPDFPPDITTMPSHTLQAIVQETMKALNSSGMIIQQLITDRIIPRDRAADALDAVAKGMWVPIKMLTGRDHIPHTMDFKFSEEKQYELTGIEMDTNKLQTRDMVEIAADKVVWRLNLTHLLFALGIGVTAAVAAGVGITQYIYHWKTEPFWS